MNKTSLTRALLAFALCFSMAFAAMPAQAQEAAKPSAEAVKLASLMARLQLEKFLEATIKDNESMKLLAADKGEEEVAPIVKEEIANAVKLHGTQWEENLALSYQDYLTKPELAALAARKPDKPTLEKFKAIQEKVGTKMKALSMPLLQQAANETLEKIVGRAEKLP